MRIRAQLIAMVLLSGIAAIRLQADEVSPEDVVTGISDRIDAVIRADAGKPLVRAKKQKPLGPGRGNYVRGYSYSMMAFAARCLSLDEMLGDANAALVENAQHVGQIAYIRGLLRGLNS